MYNTYINLQKNDLAIDENTTAWSYKNFETPPHIYHKGYLRVHRTVDFDSVGYVGVQGWTLIVGVNVKGKYVARGGGNVGGNHSVTQR